MGVWKEVGDVGHEDIVVAPSVMHSNHKLCF